MSVTLHVEGLEVPVGESRDYVNYSAMQATVMPVVSLQEGHLECWGTAVCIGAVGWFLTARHVVDDFVERYGHRTDGSTGLFVLWETDERTGTGPHDYLGAPLPVEYIHQHSEVDLVALSVRVPPRAPDRFRVATLALRMPQVGELVAVFGYSHMSLTGEVHGNERSTVQYERTLTVGAGQVMEQQFERFGRRVRGSPGFVTNAPIHPGMSGGPVMDADGDVIGFASSSSRPTNPDEEWNSYVALCGPALELDVRGREFDDSEVEQLRISDLVVADAILWSADDTFTSDPSTGKVVFRPLDAPDVGDEADAQEAATDPVDGP